VQPIGHAKVEAIRASLLRSDRFGDATLDSVLAYAGLRPGEALALTWGDEWRNWRKRVFAPAAKRRNSLAFVRTISVTPLSRS